MFKIYKQLDIRTNSTFGRYSNTAEHTKKGEIIMEEKPFVVGPKHYSGLICLGCYTPLKDCTKSKCFKCSWPLCSNTCNNIQDHSGECEIFSSVKVKFQNICTNGYCAQLDCITPLRMLIKIEADPKRWKEEVEGMEHHNESRREAKEIWNADLNNIAKYLRGPCKLHRFPEELIMKVIGILEVNAFEAKTPSGNSIRCLYPMTSILAHSCTPNTVRSIYPSDDYRIQLRALVDIEKNQQIYTSYTYILDSTAERQLHLKSGKYFTCKCKRCLDPTELGTHFSSFKCNNCSNGQIVPKDPLDNRENWKCLQCKHEQSGYEIFQKIKEMQNDVENINRMNFDCEKIKAAELLCQKFSNIVNPMHFILTNLRQILIELYGRVEGYEYENLTVDLLKHKELLCRQVLSLLDIFEPGYTRMRALILFDLYSSIITLVKKNYMKGIIDKKILSKKYKEAQLILSECADILMYDDPVSREGKLGHLAKEKLKNLEEAIEAINKNL